MPTLLSSERPLAATPSTFPTFPLLGFIAKARRARRQRLALVTLMELDAERLDDLGLTRKDLLDAMHTPPRSLGELFAARRARRAARYLGG